MDTSSVSFWFGVGGAVVGVIGVGITIFFGLENRRLNRKLKSIDWHDVVLGSKCLAADIRKEFMPDLIYAPDPRGGIVAFLLREGLGVLVPVISGATFWKKEHKQLPAWEGFSMVETTKWHLAVPKLGSGAAALKVLVVDDLSMSGDGMKTIVSVFVEKFGIAPENIKTCTLVASDTSIATEKAPNYYWRTTNDYNFMFPWGRAR